MKFLKSMIFFFVFILNSISISQVKINGFIQYQYMVEFAENKIETFKPGKINLKFSGQINKNVNWVIQFGVKEKDFNRFLKDYYVEILNPLNLKGLALKAGQFKYHWSMERSESSSDRKTIYRSQVVSALVADRDLGVEITYSLSNFKFALGVWNGEVIYKNRGTIYETIDYTRNVEDSDARKDVSGFVSYSNFKSNGEGLALDFSFLFGSNGRYSISRKDRLGFGFNFISGGLNFRNEVIWGRDDDVKKTGFYFQLSYKFVNLFEPVLKYEFWDNNINDKGVSRWFTIGVLSDVSEWARFRMNYIMRFEEPERKNNEISLMFQVRF